MMNHFLHSQEEAQCEVSKGQGGCLHTRFHLRTSVGGFIDNKQCENIFSDTKPSASEAERRPAAERSHLRTECEGEMNKISEIRKL